ncbi:hypothetical protein [Actinoplanes sp. NPDC051851]|uniref:hypothetical protein n=1 Tax=Actinoplanes sp. NPDC051851 TaxID=3154753 RepID=UPI00343E921A
MTVPTYPAAYPVQPPPPGRPTVVTISTYLLFGVAVIQIVSAIITFISISRAADVYTDSYQETSRGEILGYGVGVLVFYGIVAAGLVAVGFFNLRGKQASRVLTWILSGLMVCCGSVIQYAALAVVTALAAIAESSVTGTVPTEEELNAQLSGVMPTWYQELGLGLGSVTFLALIAVIVLLAVPQSNAFFRGQAAGGWGPYGPGYPTYPHYPAYGQQGYGQPGYGQPGYPPGQPGQPGAPAYGQPGTPAYGQSGVPDYGQPGTPAYGSPGQPGAPGYGQPATPGYGEPGQPAPGLPPYPGQAYPQQPESPTPPPAWSPPPAPENPPAPPADPWQAPPPPSSPEGGDQPKS